MDRDERYTAEAADHIRLAARGRDVSHFRKYPVQCAHPGCGASHPASRWDNIRAYSAGWFHQNDGRAWCPEHVPAWVAGWRARRRG